MGVASPNPSWSPACKRTSAVRVSVSSPRAILNGCKSGKSIGDTETRKLMAFAFHSSRGVPRKRAIVWLRRDLRLDDNAALAAAARDAGDVCIAFVIDPVLLAGPRMGAPLVQVFFGALAALR